MGPNANEHLISFLTSLVIGLLIGVKHEYADSAMGLRISALAALFGSIAALVGQSVGAPWFPPAALLAMTDIMVFGQTATGKSESHAGPTTRMAILLSFTLGAMVWLGHGRYAVMLAIAAAALLHFKAGLRGPSLRITSRDLMSILQFTTLSFIVLPLLPNVGYGPYGVFNPHHVWMMVVLISGLSLAGYLAVCTVGDRFGLPLLGLLGGLVSSTATTLVYARYARRTPTMALTSSIVTPIANLVLSVRLGIIAVAIAPSLMVTLWPVLVGNLVAGGLTVLFAWYRSRAGGPLLLLEAANPTELRVALSFGTMYAIILLLASWLSDWAGTHGLYLASAVSELTGLDAIALSTLRLFRNRKLGAEVAANAIGLAILSNLCFRTGLFAWVARRDLLLRCLPGMMAIGVGTAIGMGWVGYVWPISHAVTACSSSYGSAPRPLI